MTLALESLAFTIHVGGMVRDQGEATSQKVVAKLVEGPLDGEGLLFHRRVCPLVGPPFLRQVMQGACQRRKLWNEPLVIPHQT